MALSTGLQWAAATPALLVLFYVLILIVLTIPFVQRHALYAHKFNTCFWHDLSKPEIFGFAKNQVQELTITNPSDGTKLYAWHILPLDVYAANRDSLTSAARDSSLPVDLLRADASARVVVFLHGNGGHVAQAWRTDSFRSFSSLPHTHILTIDYRGFGRSSGTPSEGGLISDGIAAVLHVLQVWRIPPARVAIVGHSLGTAVAAAVTLYFSKPTETELLQNIAVENTKAPTPVLFAGTLLIAPFLSLPDLLLSFGGGGYSPVLAPLRPFPALHRLVFRICHHTWRTKDRLKAYFSPVEDGQSDVATGSSQRLGAIRIVHSLSDFAISYKQSEELYRLLTGSEVAWPTSEKGKIERVPTRVERTVGVKKLTVEFVDHAGHDRVCTYSVVNLAIREILGLV